MTRDDHTSDDSVGCHVRVFGQPLEWRPLWSARWCGAQGEATEEGLVQAQQEEAPHRATRKGQREGSATVSGMRPVEHAERQCEG